MSTDESLSFDELTTTAQSAILAQMTGNEQDEQYSNSDSESRCFPEDIGPLISLNDEEKRTMVSEFYNLDSLLSFTPLKRPAEEVPPPSS